MIKWALMLIPLFLSQFSIAAEDNRKYLRIGENPVNPGLILNGEKIFSLEKDIFVTTIDRNNKKSSGWLSSDYHLVGKEEGGTWLATRIFECGNPILSPRIALDDRQQKQSATSAKCKLDGGDWFYWSIGPGLIGYGAGAREKIPASVGGGLIVIELVSGSNSGHQKCRIVRKSLLGFASAGIGWLVGNALYKSEKQRAANQPSNSSGGPGPVPPNGIAFKF